MIPSLAPSLPSLVVLRGRTHPSLYHDTENASGLASVSGGSGGGGGGMMGGLGYVGAASTQQNGGAGGGQQGQQTGGGGGGGQFAQGGVTMNGRISSLVRFLWGCGINCLRKGRTERAGSIKARGSTSSFPPLFPSFLTPCLRSFSLSIAGPWGPHTRRAATRYRGRRRTPYVRLERIPSPGTRRGRRRRRRRRREFHGRHAATYGADVAAGRGG